MRRIILVALVAILCFFGYNCVTEGVLNDTLNIKISKFEQVEDDSETMTKALATYNDKNDKQFETLKNDLTVAINSYENTKAEYEELIETLDISFDTPTEEESNENVIVDLTTKAYQIEFLLATIGNYATKEGIQDLDLVFVESTSSNTSYNAGYVSADLKFTVEGEYILISNFLYDLEDDDRLAFEIRDFYMVEGKATFTVYNIPLESSTLSTITSTNMVPTEGGETISNTTAGTTNNTDTTVNDSNAAQ